MRRGFEYPPLKKCDLRTCSLELSIKIKAESPNEKGFWMVEGGFGSEHSGHDVNMRAINLMVTNAIVWWRDDDDDDDDNN